MDQIPQMMLIDRSYSLPLADFLYILVFVFYFFPLYERKTLDTKTIDSSTHILTLHVDQKSLNYFSLLNNPSSEKHLMLEGYLQAYEYDLHMHLPHELLPLFVHIVPEGFVQYFFYIFHILFSFYTSVRILYDIYNSILYVLNYSCPSWDTPPSAVRFSGRETIYILP